MTATPCNEIPSQVSADSSAALLSSIKSHFDAFALEVRGNFMDLKNEVQMLKEQLPGSSFAGLVTDQNRTIRSLVVQKDSLSASLNALQQEVTPWSSLSLAAASCNKKRPWTPFGKQSVVTNPLKGEDNDKKEVDRCQHIIKELREQIADQAAQKARRDDLQQSGRLISTLQLDASFTSVQISRAELFLKQCGPSESLQIKEPYLIAQWQIDALSELVDCMLRGSFVRTIKFSTHERSLQARESLENIAIHAASCGMSIQYAFASCIHVREFAFSNGITVSCDRGLDVFRAPLPDGVRHFRSCTIWTFESKPVVTHSSRPLQYAEKRRYGNICTLFESRGYGFASSHEHPPLFLRIEDIQGGAEAIHEGAAISFFVVTTERGVRATQVKSCQHAALLISRWWRQHLRACKNWSRVLSKLLGSHIQKNLKQLRTANRQADAWAKLACGYNNKHHVDLRRDIKAQMRTIRQNKEIENYRIHQEMVAALDAHCAQV